MAALDIGGYGASPLFQAAGTYPLDELGAPATLKGLQSFSLLPVVPEPEAWQLLLAGAVGLLWLRSRRGHR